MTTTTNASTQSVFDRINGFYDNLPRSAISEVSKHIVSLTAGAIVAAAGAACAISLIDVVCVGVLSLTGWAALAYVLWVLAATISLVMCGYIGAASARYVYNRNLTNDARFLSNKVRGWFSRSTKNAESVTLH